MDISVPFFSNISGLFRSWSKVKELNTNKLIVFILANFITNMIDSSSLKVNKSTLNIILMQFILMTVVVFMTSWCWRQRISSSTSTVRRYCKPNINMKVMITSTCLSIWNICSAFPTLKSAVISTPQFLKTS